MFNRDCLPTLNQQETEWENEFCKNLELAHPVLFDTTTTDGVINQTVYDTITENDNAAVFNFKKAEDIEIVASLVVDHLKAAIDMNVELDAVIAAFKAQLKQLQ